MTIRNRLLIISLGFTAFIIISPMLVLFALGFKFDFETKQIVKTGSLIVKSEPSKATVFLDDEAMSDVTPSTLRFLVPKDYNVSVKKNGYQAWTKRLNIKSEMVTWANLNREFIALFLEEPKTRYSNEVTYTFKDPQNESFIALQNDKLVSFGQDGQSRPLNNRALWEKLKPSITTLGDINLFHLLVFNHDLSLSIEQLAQIRKAESNSNLLAILAGSVVSIYDNSGRIVYSDQADNFTLDGNDLWLVRSGNVYRINLSNKNSDLVLSDLTAQSINVIRGNGNIFLHMGNSLYILNDKLELIYGNVTFASWSKSNQLVYGNNHELFLFDIGSQRNNLILRSSTAIQQPIVNPESGYVFFSNEGKIKAIELDDRDHRNIYNLAEAGNGFILSDNARLLTITTPNSIKTIEIR